MKSKLFKNFVVSVFCFVLFSGYAQAFVPDSGGQSGTGQGQTIDEEKDVMKAPPGKIETGEEIKYKEAEFLSKSKKRSGDDLGLIDSEAVGNGKVQPAKQKKYKDGELLVKFKKGTSESKKQGKHGKRHAKRHKKFKHIGVEHVKLDPGTTVERALAQYKADPDVEYVEPNYIVKALGTPNDPLLGNLWGLNNTGQTGGTSGADINAPEAWDISTGSGDVVVTVIDTGIDYTHEDLAGNLWVNTAEIPGNGIDDDNNGYIDDVYGINAITGTGDPFDDHGHGTHCAGTIGAVGNNGMGVAGVNWNVKIMACKFLSSGGSGYISDAAVCLDYVKMMKDRGANVVVTSNSWGGGGYSQAFYDSLMLHMQSDILFVAAAGNENSNNDAGGFYPSGYDLPNVIAVAATDHNDAKASFSSYGRHTVHVGAPGVSIYSTLPSGRPWRHLMLPVLRPFLSRQIWTGIGNL
jgi:subtilisin family serine protease